MVKNALRSILCFKYVLSSDCTSDESPDESPNDISHTYLR